MRNISIALNDTTKAATITGDDIAIREDVTVTLTNTGALDSNDLQLAVICRGKLLATCTSFTGFVGSLNLNVSPLVDYFGNMDVNNSRIFSLAIFDTTNDALVTNDTISIENNPWREGMTLPTDVTPISGATAETFTVAMKAKLDAIEPLADVTDTSNVDSAGAVMESDFSTGTLLYATSAGSPEPKTISQLSSLLGLSTTYVAKSFFDANTILAANTDDTPAALTVAEGEIVGRTSGGNIDGLTAAQVRTIINVENGADVTDTSNVNTAGAVMESDFTSAGTFLYAAVAGTPLAKTASEVNAILGNSPSSYVTKALYDAHTVLRAIADDTPAALTVNEQTIVGRKTGGNIAALTATEVRTILNVEDGAQVNLTSGALKTAYEANADTNAFTDAEKTKLGYLTLTGAASLDTINTKVGYIAITQAVDLDTIESYATTAYNHAHSVGNLHALTAADISLDNLTNHAQVRKIGASTDGNIPQWDGTDGNLLKDGFTVAAAVTDTSGAVPVASAVVDYLATYKLDDLAAPDNNTDLNASASKHGLLPKLSGTSGEYLNGVGTWTVPPDSGDVIGPASNTSGYIPRWGAADSKTLVDGLQLFTTGIPDNDSAVPSCGAVIDYLAAYKLDDFGTPDDNTDLNATSGRHGLLPKLSASAGDVLLGDGTWGSNVVLPTGSATGDMAYYDSTSGWVKLAVGADGTLLRCNGSGSAPSWDIARYETTFADGDLDANGEITITHNLGYQYVQVRVIDNNDKLLNEPDEITFDSTTALTLKLESFQTLSGTWRVICSL